MFASAILLSIHYGFLAISGCFMVDGGGVAQLGRSSGVDSSINGQIVVHDSVISESSNMVKPWVNSVIAKRPFAGNTGAEDDKDEIQRNLNDTNSNRMWEYSNCGIGSKAVTEPEQ